MERKVWVQQYTRDVPETINPDQFASLVEFFDHYCQQFSERPVFTSFGVSLSYAQLHEKATHFAAFLQQHCKVTKGDRLAIMMPNLLQYPVAIFGALKAGLTVVNVNPLYTVRELKEQLKDAGATTIVVLENFADHLQAALPETAIKNVIVAKIGDLLGCVKGALFNFALKCIKRAIPHYDLPQKILFKNALALGAKLQFLPVDIEHADLAFLQYTGGTTGRSKGAMLTHRNILANVVQCVTWIHDIEEQHHGILLGALPMYHIFALTVCGICIFQMGASTVLVANPRDIKGLLKQIRPFKMSMMVGLNTLFNGMLNHSDFAKLNFSQLRLSIAGGMAMQKCVADRWKKATGSTMLQGYGLTESSPVITLCPITMTEFTGSAGLPISSTEVTIRDENKRDLGLNETGEICARGPQVMLGYWHAEEETRQVIDEEGWLYTGDIGYMDEKGFLFIVDRKKDMVLVSGFNVYPNEIEAVLSSHPGVQTAAVIGVPSEQTGEALKAFIIKKDPALTAEDLIAFCRKSLTGYKIPKLIEFRDTLPLSPVGKVLRRELRE